jgi:threonine dehydrogenase-like Zn-dependent dehydrogenase
MRALVITGRESARVEEVGVPEPGDGQVVVDVRRAGICGTDVELFTGQLAYFAQGRIGSTSSCSARRSGWRTWRGR